jgi:transposase
MATGMPRDQSIMARGASTWLFWELDDGLSVGSASRRWEDRGSCSIRAPGNSSSQKMAPRHLAWLFLRDPEQLEKQEKQTLSLIRKAQQVEIAYGLAQHFVTLLKEHNAQPLETWLWHCQMSGISDLVTFAQGLAKEGSALHAAFTLPYSNGPVEGKINKLKYIKRSMYGRGGFPLLRQRVLKAA